jgi:hypothetical protein
MVTTRTPIGGPTIRKQFFIELAMGEHQCGSFTPICVQIGRQLVELATGLLLTY